MPGMEKNEAVSTTRDSARAPTARGKACPIDLSASASIRVGGRLQFLFFLDDFIPSILAKPLFSEHPLFSR
jgi:hypothetical protein